MKARRGRLGRAPLGPGGSYPCADAYDSKRAKEVAPFASEDNV